MHNFYPLEVVSRGRETQLQVGGNLNRLTRQDKGFYYVAAEFFLANSHHCRPR